MIAMEVDPCEDLYEFVCGRTLNTTELPEDAFRINISEEKLKKISKLVLYDNNGFNTEHIIGRYIITIVSIILNFNAAEEND